MDFTGTRRYGRENDDSVAARFFQEICEAIIARVHPEPRFHPLSHEQLDPDQSLVIRNWRLAGYYLASYLLPTRRKRHPVELEQMIAGMRQRMQEYELELQADGVVDIEAFDVDGCERLESKAEKFLKLATHEGTPPEEARAAAYALAKMIANNDLALLAWERVRHFARRFHQMQELFDMLQQENPLLFIYGAKMQQPPRH
jgi:hypothetical protein